MKVFWSWQSDTPAKYNKEFVKEALNEALKVVSEELGLTEAERPEIDHDTKGAPGLVAIVDEIFKKIEQADVFVGDVTFVGQTSNGKLLPNANVMIELGHALTSVGHEGIILVSNMAFGGKVEDLPFDLRHRRGPITYSLKDSASPEKRAKELARLTNALVESLKLNLAAALVKCDAEAKPVLHPSRDGDRSTWLAEGERIQFSDTMFSGMQKEFVEPASPRAYMRLAPAGWKVKPNRNQVVNAPDQVRLWAMGPWREGDYGPNAQGAVSVGLIGGEGGTIGVTQWFNKTGEIWGFTNSATYPHASGKRMLSAGSLAKTWDEFLQKGLRFLEHFDAFGPVYVEAGLVGIESVHWADDHWGHHPRALENEVHLERSHRKWTPEECRAFLTDLYNLMLDVFGKPHVGPEGVPRGH